MRTAFFSPLPPAKTGIADYSAALLDPLARHTAVDVFSAKPARLDSSHYDALVFQLGNNPHHSFVYEAALDYPGVAVLHEANLHHLIAHLTFCRGDQDAYWREVVLNGGSRTTRGPDYEIPMLRTILDHSRAAIVHSATVEQVVRAHGFTRPVARIPHGTWLLNPDRAAYRSRLGLHENTPLFGIFGFLKPYKRIAQAVRAFKKLVRDVPEARLILVGEKHPELSLDLPAQARHIDFAPIDDFNGYLAACDVIINLRYPTVGENSGTLHRAFGMGKAVMVSDVGSFHEYPDNVCLKVPVDWTESEYLYEFMRVLAMRPEIARAIGARARDWAARHCSWDSVAERYARFLNDYTVNWMPAEDPYIETHRTRLEKTLEITPHGGPTDYVLEMGAYMQITPLLHTRLGYGNVRGCYFGKAGTTETREVELPEGGTFSCKIDHFDAEGDFFPYPSAHFSTILCCELLEHLARDPMYMMNEIHRILRPGGHLVLTTPNVTSLRAAAAVLQGYHPMLFPAYIKDGEERRHSREYTPNEIRQLFENSGLEVTLLETGPFRDEPKPELAWVEHLLDKYSLPKEHRGEGIYAVGRKIGPVRERYPAWLYA
jgi:glycosyltransferase involved in cell wall biosynthesis